MTLKIFLLVYLILFYGVAFFWRTYRVWRTTGINPYRLSEKEGLPGFMATYFRLIVAGTLLVVLIKIFADRFYQALTPITWPERAKITALACSEAPEGHGQWSLRLLAEKAVELEYVEQISHMQVARILKKTNSNRT